MPQGARDYCHNNKCDFPNHMAPWTTEATNDLILRYLNGEDIYDLSVYFGRTLCSITSRLNKLGLYNYNGESAKYTFMKNKQTLSDRIEKNRQVVSNHLINAMRTIVSIDADSQEYAKLHEVNRMVDPYILKVEKMLSISIQDMVDNGWYKNEGEARYFLEKRLGE